MIEIMPYQQEEIQNPSFRWGLLLESADSEGMQKTIKPSLIKPDVFFFDYLNQRASKIFNENC